MENTGPGMSLKRGWQMGVFCPYCTGFLRILQVLPTEYAMSNPIKPWKSFEEQLALLKSRGLQVEDEQLALHYLSTLGYYRLSGYWYPLRKIDKAASAQQGKPVRLNEFVEDSCFEDVVRLYVFDKKLRLLALDALERIEMAVRVDVAHTLGKRDPLAHKKPDCLHDSFAKHIGKGKSKTEHALWLEKYQALLHTARREPFVKHHQQNYDGELPVWVAIELGISACCPSCSPE